MLGFEPWQFSNKCSSVGAVQAHLGGGGGVIAIAVPRSWATESNHQAYCRSFSRGSSSYCFGVEVTESAGRDGAGHRFGGPG